MAPFEIEFLLIYKSKYTVYLIITVLAKVKVNTVYYVKIYSLTPIIKAWNAFINISAILNLDEGYFIFVFFFFFLGIWINTLIPV